MGRKEEALKQVFRESIERIIKILQRIPLLSEVPPEERDTVKTRYQLLFAELEPLRKGLNRELMGEKFMREIDFAREEFRLFSRKNLRSMIRGRIFIGYSDKRLKEGILSDLEKAKMTCS